MPKKHATSSSMDSEPSFDKPSAKKIPRLAASSRNSARVSTDPKMKGSGHLEKTKGKYQTNPPTRILRSHRQAAEAGPNERLWGVDKLPPTKRWTKKIDCIQQQKPISRSSGAIIPGDEPQCQAPPMNNAPPASMPPKTLELLSKLFTMYESSVTEARMNEIDEMIENILNKNVVSLDEQTVDETTEGNAIEEDNKESKVKIEDVKVKIEDIKVNTEDIKNENENLKVKFEEIKVEDVVVKIEPQDD